MYDHILFLKLQITKSDIRPHIKWAVSLVIAYGLVQFSSGLVFWFKRLGHILLSRCDYVFQFTNKKVFQSLYNTVYVLKIYHELSWTICFHALQFTTESEPLTDCTSLYYVHVLLC